jgi:hypothetical protein
MVSVVSWTSDIGTRSSERSLRWCAASPGRRRGSIPACRRRSRGGSAGRQARRETGRGCRRGRRTRRCRAPSRSAQEAVVPRARPRRRIHRPRRCRAQPRTPAPATWARGRDPLHQGVDGGQHDARLVLGRAGAGEAGERRHPGGGDGGGRRDPVVGLAVPGRQAHHVHLGRDEAQSRLERGRAPGIARHVHQHGRCVDGGRQGTGEVGERQRVEALRGVRQDRAVAALEGVDRPGERGGFRQREARDRRLGGGGGGLRLRLGHRVFRGEARRARQGRRSGGVSRSGRRDKASRRKRLGG